MIRTILIWLGLIPDQQPLLPTVTAVSVIDAPTLYLLLRHVPLDDTGDK